MGDSRPVLCPRCGCWTVHISTVVADGLLADVLIWCAQCDDNEHPYEQATD